MSGHKLTAQCCICVAFLQRQRFFLAWRGRFHLVRFSTRLALGLLQRAFRVWTERSAEKVEERNNAATRIQACVRRRQASQRYPSLLAAAAFSKRIVLQRGWKLWLKRAQRIARWQTRWSSRLSHGALSCHLPPSPFPARRLRASEGTMALAVEWAGWRRKCVAWSKWIKYLAEKGRSRTD
jgi:hypothetical protein